LIWAGGGYAGRLVVWAAWLADWTPQIVGRSDDVKGFKVLPERGIVEHAFGWAGGYRRLSKDYEAQGTSSETRIYLAMINLTIH
jgi:transposase